MAQGRYPLAHAHSGLLGAAPAVGVLGGDGFQEVKHCPSEGKVGAGFGGGRFGREWACRLRLGFSTSVFYCVVGALCLAAKECQLAA